MIFIFVFIFLLVFLLGYLRLASHLSIIDKPNDRSSHGRITISGGGIIFPVAAVLWFILSGFQDVLIIAGLVIIATVSFIDDLRELSRITRLIAQLISVSLLFWGTGFFEYPVYIFLPAYIVVIGWINIFNFMDGINGITSFYSLVAMATFLFLTFHFDFTDPDLLHVILISILIFGFFNARKEAKVFAGDIGSVTLAYLLAMLIVRLIIETGRIEYILMFSVYLVDGVFTILFRLIRGENIFKAHRSHLYQYLSNELGIPHVFVSLLYAGLQLMINILIIWLTGRGIMNIHLAIIILFILSVIYLAVRFYVLRFAGKRLSELNINQ